MEFLEEAGALFGESSGGGGGRDEGRVDIDPTLDLFANIGSRDGELFFANVLFLPLGLVDRAPYFRLLPVQRRRLDTQERGVYLHEGGPTAVAERHASISRTSASRSPFRASSSRR